MSICNNTLIAILGVAGIVAICVMECVAIATGHDGQFFNWALGGIILLSGGGSAVGSIKKGLTPNATQP